MRIASCLKSSLRSVLISIRLRCCLQFRRQQVVGLLSEHQLPRLSFLHHPARVSWKSHFETNASMLHQPLFRSILPSKSFLAEVLIVSPKRRKRGSFRPMTPARIAPVCMPILNFFWSKEGNFEVSNGCFLVSVLIFFFLRSFAIFCPFATSSLPFRRGKMAKLRKEAVEASLRNH